MAYLAGVKKEGLRSLCEDLGLTVTSKTSVIAIRDLIINDTNYDEEFIREHLKSIIQNRKSDYEQRMKEIESERAFELEKLRLSQPQQSATARGLGVDKPTIEIQKLLPKFKPQEDDIGLFLTLFERQLSFLNVPKENFVTYLIIALPGNISKLIAREPQTLSQDYDHIKNMLLKRFKLSAEKFRLLFSQHRKATDSTWKDFFFELRTYFEGWLSELEISSFDKLKELNIADQIKKKCPPEYENHYLDIWETLNDPVTLDEKLDLYENIKSPYQKVIKNPKLQEWYKPKFPRNAGSQNLKNSQFTKFENTDSSSTHKNTISNSSNMLSRNVDNSVYCYGCGYPGFIKSKCPKCSPKKDGAHVNAIQVFNCFTLPVALLDIEVYEATGTVCADTGASQSVGGELMFNFLQKRGQKFIEIDLAVCLADGQQSTSTVLKTTVPITVHGRTFHTDLIFLPHAKEECESPFAAPVVLVPKPNGDIRLCIDYRKLNAITVPDRYPLPLMDTLLHDAKSIAFMSTLDLKTGYHQIEVNPDDKDKTAFVCPFGMFRYKRMPFGLKNAPATFQRLMDQFRNGLPTVNILVYLDDIVVLSETFEQHIQDLKMVFDRLRKFKLCTCSWYRKFIPNFSDIARPLSNLTKKNIVWKWSEQEQQAFKTLKQRLVTPPVLRQVDPTKPFIIRTDASGYGLGAVLLQGDSPADERPIEYASRLLSPAEKNYSMQLKEKPWL
ncbi:Retrovirus-related Pol polyprotein from transposon 17.6 [Araneus ventricosus]|uniref:RNA-directed DNA polymerase n=1 Tax=Araneus ventricosus TaxID=182803 RepID=A0A4Y2KG96_ARAVE|nr:Retrovirus-related Pol polyprotein from transposon 17.6 [Araneus ventricosus]